jgi:hypothetical protein
MFRWKIEKWEGPFDYWLVNTGEEDEPGIHGAIMTKDMGLVIRDTISVDSYDDFAKKIEKEGGKMLSEKMEPLVSAYSLKRFKSSTFNLMVICCIFLLSLLTDIKSPISSLLVDMYYTIYYTLIKL